MCNMGSILKFVHREDSGGILGIFSDRRRSNRTCIYMDAIHCENAIEITELMINSEPGTEESLLISLYSWLSLLFLPLTFVLLDHCCSV